MKISIVTPNERNMLEGAGDRMPLGATYVATAAKKAGHDVRMFDLNHYDKKHFLHHAMYTQPDVIGYSVISSPSYNSMNHLLKTAKKLTPNAKHVVGGYHANARPQDFPDADFVIQGDGEKAIVDVAAGRTPQIGMQRTQFNKIPFPDRSLLNTTNYNMMQNGLRTATMITSKGCPGSCVFCGNYDKKTRFRTLENISDELEQISNLEFKALYLLDDAFTVNKRFAKDVSDVINSYKMPFRITTRADLLDEPTIKHLAKNGMEIASIGIESGNDKVLQNLNKRTTTSQIEKTVTMLGDYGVDVKGFFMFGAPGESIVEAQQTIDFALKLKEKGLTSADFYCLTPFPGTPVANNPEKFGGRIMHNDWDKYLEIGKEEVQPAWETDMMSAEQIKFYMEIAKETWNRN